MNLFYQPEGRLRLTLEDRSYVTVKPAWASPLSYPGKHLSLLDGKGKEITMLAEPERELSKENWALIQEELRRRYLNGVVLKVLQANTEFGATYWTVETDRGLKEFVTQSLQENAQWLGPAHLLLVDVDGNRFEIPDINALDEESRRRVNNTV